MPTHLEYEREADEIDEHLEKAKKSPYKYHKKVTIDLYGDKKERVEKIANNYFLVDVKKKDNDPKDKENYVSINMTKEDVKNGNMDRCSVI